MTISQWSITPANNASGVTSVNWAEGQAPSTVNDSARQLMADVAVVFTAQTLTDAATVNWDANSGWIATVTLGGNRTMAAPTNMQRGTMILHVIQDGTGSRTLTWNAVFKWQSATAPTLSTGAGKRDVFCFVCDGTNLYGNAMLDVR